MIKLIIAVLSSILLSSCSTTSPEGESTISELDLDTKSTHVIIAKTKQHKNGYKHGKGWYKVEWSTCTPTKSDKTILLMHDEGDGFDSKDPCNDWRSQIFLAKNFNVILINRPGHGKSTGKKDFVGDHSLKAMNLALKKYLKKYNKEKINGIWGYSFGAVAATLLSKKNSYFDWLIVGGGIYDFDETLSNTKNDSFREKINKIKGYGSDALSKRSIAYDVEGLPKKIFMYHGKLDQTVLLTEAEVFKETLSAMEIQADLEVFASQNHMISSKLHAVIIKKILSKVEKN